MDGNHRDTRRLGPPRQVGRVAVGVERVHIPAAEQLGQRHDAERDEDGDQDGEEAVGVRHERDAEDAREDEQLERRVPPYHAGGHAVEEVEAACGAPRRVRDEEDEPLVERVAAE